MENKLILGAICGSIAEAYYGYLNNDLQEVVVNKLDDIQKNIVATFSKIIEEKNEKTE